MNPSPEPLERRFTLDLRTGEIRPAGAPERQDDEEQWIELGELGPGIDYSRARGWRPLGEFWRW
jgi:hypothetical protein